MRTLGDLYKKILGDNDFENIEYIKKILSCYGKEQLYITRCIDNLQNTRIKHIVSMFLMGRLLYDSSTAIKNAMDSFINSHSLFPDTSIDDNNTQCKFYFIWMLTAFYHDVGYFFENEEDVCMRKINDVLVFEYPLNFGDKFIPKCYDKNLLDSYAWYRFITSRKYDHGIIGAQDFYKNLMHSNPYNRIPTYNVYKIVCLCIACHNIWFPNDDTISIYKAFGLTNLTDIYEKSPDQKIRTIKLKNHSLLFLLSLADNLDPSKKYNNEDWMGKVSFDFSETNNEIRIISDNERYTESLQQLNSWLIDVNSGNEKNSVVLHLPAHE